MLAASLLPAQVVFDPSGATTMTRYLELTSQQTAQVTSLRIANAQFRLEKQNRIAVIQRELQVELKKNPLDPMAIGLRYVEIATIEKEIVEADTKLKNDLRALLTDAQKGKLKPLEEAQRLQSLVNQAVCEGFLDPLPVASVASGVLVSFENGTTGNFCLATVGFPPIGVNGSSSPMP